jgi:hypothetical protein
MGKGEMEKRERGGNGKGEKGKERKEEGGEDIRPSVLNITLTVQKSSFISYNIPLAAQNIPPALF